MGHATIEWASWFPGGKVSGKVGVGKAGWPIDRASVESIAADSASGLGPTRQSAYSQACNHVNYHHKMPKYVIGKTNSMAATSCAHQTPTGPDPRSAAVCVLRGRHLRSDTPDSALLAHALDPIAS